MYKILSIMMEMRMLKLDLVIWKFFLTILKVINLIKNSMDILINGKYNK